MQNGALNKRDEQVSPKGELAHLFVLLLLCFALLRAAVDVLFERRVQKRRVDGLGEMFVHACVDRALLLLGKGIRRHSDDGDCLRIGAR